MNILLINHYAGSPEKGMDYRPYYLASEWTKLGHTVVILAADRSHLRIVNPRIDKDFTEELINGVKYVWFKTPKYEGNGLSRIINMFTFVRKLMKNKKRIAETYKPDVVIASSTYTPDNYAAYKIAKRAKAKYIYEVHDLWPLSVKELGGYSKWHPFIMLLQHAENYAYKRVDAVVSMLPNTKEHMKSHGLDLCKWNCIPNGIALDEWNSPTSIPSEHETLINELKSKNAFLVGYVGSHGISNSLHTLLEAVSRMIKPDIHFVMIGKGAEKEKLMSYAKENNLVNIHFKENVPKSCIPNLLSKFDALFIGWHKNPLYRFGISPNKLMDYMMSGKPIIHSVEAANDLVRDAQCGISVPPENPDAIADAINKLYSMSGTERLLIGEKGKEHVVANLTYAKLAKEFIEIMCK